MSLGPNDTLIINEKLKIAHNDTLYRELETAKVSFAFSTSYYSLFRIN